MLITLVPKLGDYEGHVISSIIAIAYILVIKYLFVSNIRPYKTNSLF